MRLFSLLFLAILFSSNTFARIEVAFLAVKKSDGTHLQLEKNGRFAHVAIRYNDKWLHVHPEKGVELVENLNDIGVITETLINERAPSLTAQQVDPLLGLSADKRYSWENPDSSYCSKLIAKILNIKPTPMTFDASHWRGFRNLPIGELGISPDELFTELTKRNFLSKAPLCVKVL